MLDKQNFECLLNGILTSTMAPSHKNDVIMMSISKKGLEFGDNWLYATS